jgi:hypothetical protein
MADEDMEDPEDASEDPEPIAISSAEAADPTLVAVLESEVGLAPEYWDAAVWQRYALPEHPLSCSISPVMTEKAWRLRVRRLHSASRTPTAVFL